MKAMIAILGTLAPAAAVACSACARDSSPYAALLVAGLIAAPYVVAAVVVRAIRSAGGEP